MARKREQEEASETNLEEEADHGEPRVYELAFHIDPDLPQEEIKRVFENLKETIAQQGVVIAEGEPERITLAYTISRALQEGAGRRDFGSAFFAWVAYEANGEGHAAVAEAVRTEKRVFRFLDIKTEVDIVRHAAEERLLRTKTENPGREQVVVSDAELDAAIEGAAPAS